MLVDGYVAVYEELRKLKARAMTDTEPMSLADTKRMHMLVQQLSILAKEEREQKREEKLDKLSDAELLELAKEAAGKIGGK